jgi:hypothetical protein
MKHTKEPPKFDVFVTDQGLVAVRFEEATTTLALNSEQAKSFGLGLIEMGTRAEYVLRFGEGRP